LIEGDLGDQERRGFSNFVSIWIVGLRDLLVVSSRRTRGLLLLFVNHGN